VIDRMHPADLERLAELVADHLTERLRPVPAGELVDAAELAQRFGVSRDWAYQHASRLGVVRLGDGPRARLRFDPAKVREALAGPQPEIPSAGAPRPPRRRRRTAGASADLLPIRGPRA
jgi:hypothetical protein